MKIIIEHKKPQTTDSDCLESVSHNVTIEHPSDDLDADCLARLLFYAMTACGYHVNSVMRSFNRIAIEQGLGELEDESD